MLVDNPDNRRDSPSLPTPMQINCLTMTYNTLDVTGAEVVAWEGSACDLRSQAVSSLTGSAWSSLIGPSM